MKIGIHKLGFEVEEDLTMNKDVNGMSSEVSLILLAFKAHGHDIEYADTNIIPDRQYDIIYVFNGYENSTSCLAVLKEMCYELNYILTDSRFYQDDIHIDNYFVQSTNKVFSKPTFNSKLHKLPIYETTFSDTNIINKFYTRKNRLIFGGSVRERKEKVLEYIIRPEVDYFLKFNDLGLDTRLPIKEYRRLLNDYNFGLTILNPLDIIIGNITWRYYEYIANGILTFVDRESDPNNFILDKGNFMYVSSYEELFLKMKRLSNDKELRRVIIQEQTSRMHIYDFTGRTFVNSLLESREENC